LWIASYPVEKAVKNPEQGLWIGCAPVARSAWRALGSVRRRGETIQPHAHFLDCLALQGMPMMSEDDGRAR
jgi:hypothetical protein